VQPLWFLSGIVLYIFALWLFWYAVAANWKRPLALAFTKTPPHHLVAGGPYRFIRHPFYTSYLLAWGAGFAVTGNPLTLLALAVMGSLYWLAARSEERLFAQSSLAGTYQAYKSETGMFWPKFQALSAIYRSKLDSSIKK
jgi:protein-S-isoprenylcysteine O-methyltransferase Ste14